MLNTIQSMLEEDLKSNKAEEEEMESEIKDHFKLPIEYQRDIKPVRENIIDDLALENVYSKIFDSSDNIYAKEVAKMWQRHYSTDPVFLLDSQKLVKKWATDQKKKGEMDSYKEINEIWREVRSPFGFLEKYQFVDWKRFAYLNENEHFLQALSIYNIAAPVISLIMPILGMIIPYFILRLQGIHLSLSQYIDHLKIMIQQNSLGKLLYHLSRFEFDKCVYSLFTLVIYVFQIYLNVLSCIRFVSNMTQVNRFMNAYRGYIQQVIGRMDLYDKCSMGLTTMTGFNAEMKAKRCILQAYLDRILRLETTFSVFSWKSMCQLGVTMKCLYDLHFNEDLGSALLYSYGFMGYTDCLSELSKQVENGIMTNADYAQIVGSSDSSDSESDSDSDSDSESGKRKINSGKINSGKMDDENENENKNEKEGSFPEEKNENEEKKKEKEKEKKKKLKYKLKCENAWYPLCEDDPVKNSFYLKKEMIITGPNAAGKTTFIKSALLSVLLSQQIGFGFYDEYMGTLFDEIHCYLNIPDTSGRDSLFQAEARRCKDIINTIKTAGKQATHFCIFDEIFSGTNPVEAISSANGFIQYIAKKKNVAFMLTTHFVELCKMLEKEAGDEVENYCMHVDQVGDDFNYTFEIEKGISNVLGGRKVLKEMDFPEEMMKKI